MLLHWFVLVLNGFVVDLILVLHRFARFHLQATSLWDRFRGRYRTIKRVSERRGLIGYHRFDVAAAKFAMPGRKLQTIVPSSM